MLGAWRGEGGRKPKYEFDCRCRYIKDEVGGTASIATDEDAVKGAAKGTAKGAAKCAFCLPIRVEMNLSADARHCLRLRTLRLNLSSAIILTKSTKCV